MTEPNPSFFERVKRLILGGERSLFDPKVFHHISLIAFFAWVGLGADGLSSSCYGPAEAFLALEKYPNLTIFVAIAASLTVLLISASYAQIIELFPTGGGGYLVASKLLSPSAGMVSGCALVLDYVLTIAISITEGVRAVLSFLPPHWAAMKMPLIFIALLILTLMNLRGVKESVIPLVPIFMIFLITHLLVIFVTLIIKADNFTTVYQATANDLNSATTDLKWYGMLFVMMRAFSMGAGTYTGIEAVSNGLPILREPRVVTGKRTMRYMAISLATMALGLMLAYLLFDIGGLMKDKTIHEALTSENKTVNAVLFEQFTAGWTPFWGHSFIWITLISEAAILFVAAQAGFLDGPRVLSYMALDGWMPHRFAHLSDRLVTHNGIWVMTVAAAGVLILTGGQAKFLIVLYSINVFITFCLSQSGMVRHWWLCRATEAHWFKGLLLNGTGLAISIFILVSTVVIKFTEGGWLTIGLTGSLVLAVILIRRHYKHTSKLLRRLDGLVQAAENAPAVVPADQSPAEPDLQGKTAVLLVNGFNGLGLHTLLNVVRLFPHNFKNFVFVSVGVVDVGNFKGAAEVQHLQTHTRDELDRYVRFAQRQGFYGEQMLSVGTDVVDEVADMAPKILEKFPNAIFFGGQLVFPNESSLTRLLHNNTVFAIQRRLYALGVPVIVLPIRV